MSYFRLGVIRLEDLRWKHPLHSETPDLYVEAEIEGTVRRTGEIESKTPSWNESLVFPVCDETNRLRVAVKHKSSWSKDPCIGITELMLSHLLANYGAEVPLELFSPKHVTMTTCRIFLRLETIDSTEAVSAIIPQLAGQGKLYQAVGTLLRRLDRLRPIMDGLTEIHPFFKAAWSLTSALYDTVQRVFGADAKMIDLVRTMGESFEFVQDAQKLRDRAAFLQKAFDGLLKQTIECCIFVRQYVSHSFARRMLQTSEAEKIEEFQQSFLGFKREVDSGVTLHTAFVSVRVAQVVDNLLLHQLLNPSRSDAFERPVCLPGTRLEIRDKIIEWVFSETKQNIFWLHGVAGSGKSTVSSTIASHFRQMSRLGAFLFFERGKSEPSSVIRTIAYKLARYDSSIREKIVLEVTKDHDVIGASSVDQFNRLLLHPLTSTGSSTPGPVVIVLDALDECGTPEMRRSLMNLMTKEFPKLPNTFRFLVTSRREVDIDQAFSSCSDFVCATALAYSSPTGQSDVLYFLHAELDAIWQSAVLRREWPWDENIGLLGKVSCGLFIWASTAIKMVKDSDSPFYELDNLVSSVKSSRSDIGLDELYATVLRNSGIKWEKERSRNRFASILSLLLLCKVPLSAATIDGLLGVPPEEPSILILSRLQSVVTYSEGGPISLLHASFSDYLVSSNPLSDPWCIDLDKAKHHIAERCLSVMKDLLRFNICDLDSSFVRNDDVPDLAECIKSRIPPHLEYACFHWSQHLVEARHSSELLRTLADFMHHRILFWFEVLSLTKAFARVATVALSEASRWSGLHDASVASFLLDARKLASMFGAPIVESAPHIYVSMIPFSKGDSEVAARYSKCMSSVVRVERMGVKTPPLCLKVFEKRGQTVNVVIFCPNGRHVASASDDGTVRVWDLDSGEEIFEPLTGYTVCFSSDGGRIVSSSDDGDLRVWDGRKGCLVLGPLQGHLKQVKSIAWSPDGSAIASGSADKTIIIRDAADGKPIFRLCGHTDEVNSVSFSPDSSRLASGSSDRTVRVWDLKNGEIAFGPFKGHCGVVNSVAFCPDGKHVASGSDDFTTIVWEVESGSIVATLEEHTRGVTSVAYSPCGTRIISGSVDKTVRVWDAKFGEIVSTLEGHTDWVNFVAVSPDGKYIASGSHDKSVRIWDAATRSNSKTTTEHSRGITSVAFSPDGRRIASASWDCTVIVWDAQTGDAEFQLHGHIYGVNSVAFVPNGSRLVSGSRDKTIRIWDAITGEPVSEPLEHIHAVECIAVSPDSLTVAAGSESGTISVWSIETGQPVVWRLRRHSDSVKSVTFSPDGRRFASGSIDRSVIIWDTDRWVSMHEPLTGHSSSVSSICFSQDSSRIASGSRDLSIIVWDTENGQKLARLFMGHTESVSSVIFSPDGKHLISGSFDNTIRIWDAQNVQTVHELEGHTDDVNSLALSPDGCTIISASSDNTIRMWDLSDVLQSPVENTSMTKTLSRDWILAGNGWILGGQDQRDLFVWVPPDLRRTLQRPRNTAILNCGFSTKLDFTGATLGKRWTECFALP